MFLCFFAKFQSSNKVLCKNDYKSMGLESKYNNTCVFYNYQGKETDLLITFSVIKWLYYPHSVTKKIRTTLLKLSVSIISLVLCGLGLLLFLHHLPGAV